MQFRGAADERKVGAEAKTKHVGRRIDQPQAAIQIKWIADEFRSKPLRQDSLKNISRDNVLFHFFHGDFEALTRHVALHICWIGRALRIDVAQLTW